ncbi:MAG TPA: group III truncated hemoglobin [Saprospiraceae bacterium]|nr:group III truncated hemoglobin [Saprospiraceae bacterium]
MNSEYKNFTDIATIEDISLLVHTFYDKIRKDDLLGSVFHAVIQNNWDVHLEKMVRFWQTVLFDTHTYFGRPFPPHANLPIEKVHFDRWLSLFTQTVDEHFSGEKADRAKWQAERMAEMFQSKIAYYKQSNIRPII